VIVSSRSRTRTLRAVCASLALSVAAVGGTTHFAGATEGNDSSTPSTVPASPSEGTGKSKAGCLNQVDRRVRDLAAWTTKVNAMTQVSAATKAALTTQMATVSTQLTTVAKPAIEAATTNDAIKAACKAVGENYRVYKLVHPQVFLTAGADETLTKVADLRARLAAATGGAGNADVTKLLDDAAALATPVPAAVAGFTPASYNANQGAAKAALDKARADLKTARHKVKDASKQVKKLEKNATKCNREGVNFKKGKGKGRGNDDNTCPSTTTTSTTTTSPASTTTTAPTTTTTSTSTSTTSTTRP
jgi:hypothetical protein